MTDPAITAALEKLIANTPPPVTVWGIRYAQVIEEHADGFPFVVAIPAGHIDWYASETGARKWLAVERSNGYSAELVHITGRVHPADGTATSAR